MKKLLKEFKDFIMRGNVMDLAIGIIIGSAFSTVVNSIVENILMPPLGFLLGKVDFQDLFIVLRGREDLPPNATLEMAREVGAVTLNYGQFITDLISFVIIGFAVFLIIKSVNTIQENAKQTEKEEPAEPTEKPCPYCQKSIPVKATRCPFCTSELEEV